MSYPLFRHLIILILNDPARMSFRGLPGWKSGIPTQAQRNSVKSDEKLIRFDVGGTPAFWIIPNNPRVVTAENRRSGLVPFCWTNLYDQVHSVIVKSEGAITNMLFTATAPSDSQNIQLANDFCVLAQRLFEFLPQLGEKRNLNLEHKLSADWGLVGATFRNDMPLKTVYLKTLYAKIWFMLFNLRDVYGIGDLFQNWEELCLCRGLVYPAMTHAKTVDKKQPVTEVKVPVPSKTSAKKDKKKLALAPVKPFDPSTITKEQWESGAFPHRFVDLDRWESGAFPHRFADLDRWLHQFQLKTESLRKGGAGSKMDDLDSHQRFLCFNAVNVQIDRMRRKLVELTNNKKRSHYEELKLVAQLQPPGSFFHNAQLDVFHHEGLMKHILTLLGNADLIKAYGFQDMREKLVSAWNLNPDIRPDWIAGLSKQAGGVIATTSVTTESKTQLLDSKVESAGASRKRSSYNDRPENEQGSPKRQCLAPATSAPESSYNVGRTFFQKLSVLMEKYRSERQVTQTGGSS